MERSSDEARRLLEGILAAIDDGITVQDRTGRLIYANAAAARAVGFPSPEALLAEPIERLMPRFEVFGEDGTPFASDRLPARAVLAGRDHAPPPVLLRYCVRDTGEERWSHVRARAVLDEHGALSYAVNVFRDITAEQREAQQRRFLLGAVERFNSASDYRETLSAVARELVPAIADWATVDVIEDGELRRLAVAHADPAKVALVEDVSRRFAADAVRGPRAVIATGTPALVSEITDETLVAAARSPEHLAMMRALGLRSYVSVPLVGRTAIIGALSLATAESGRVYRDADLRFAITLAERAAFAIERAHLLRETERALARQTDARAAAERASHLSDVFVGVLGHDLRTPLTAIATGAQLILRAAADEAVRRPAVRIVGSAERMQRMIGQLLDLTRIRLGAGLTVAPAAVNLVMLARQIIEEIEAAHQITIAITHRGEPLGIWDPDRLAQVLTNLLGNAAQHGAGGPITVDIDGDVPERVVLEVGNGGRVPDDVLAHLFEPLAGGAESRGSRGLGLGLFITREIVRAHGGTIVLASTDAGTVARVELPRRSQPTVTPVPIGQLTPVPPRPQ